MNWSKNWIKVVTALIIVLGGGLFLFINPTDFSIQLDGDTIASYSNNVFKVYKGRFVAFEDVVKPLYWNGKGYTTMYKSSKCEFGKYSNLSYSNNGNDHFIRQDICYSKGIMTRHFIINKFSVKESFEFIPTDPFLKTKFYWEYGKLDLGKREVYFSGKNKSVTSVEMDFDIVNSWEKEKDNIVRVERFLNGKIRMQTKVFKGNVSFDPTIFLTKNVKGSNTISVIELPITWDYEIIQTSPELEKVELVHLGVDKNGDNIFKKIVVMNKSYTLNKNYRLDSVICINKTIQKNNLSLIKTKVKNGWCIKNGGDGIELRKSITNPTDYNETFIVDKSVESFYDNTGNGTTIVYVTSSSLDGDFFGFKNQMYYDYNLNRSFFLIHSNGTTQSLISANDTVTWTTPVQIISSGLKPTAYTMKGYTDPTQSIIHVIDAADFVDYFNWRQVNISNTDPYIFVPGSQRPFDSSNWGNSSVDDIGWFRMDVDDYGCPIMATGYQYGGSLSNPAIFKKSGSDGSTCRNGSWLQNTFATNYPKWRMDTTDTANKQMAGIFRYHNTDLYEVVWVAGPDNANMVLESRVYNESGNSLFLKQTLDTDVEFSSAGNAFQAITTSNGSFIAFGLDDGSQDLDAYVKSWYNDTVTQIDTGLNIPDSANGQGVVTVIEDTCNEVLWLFAVDNADLKDIYYVNSTDNGITWSTPILWLDDVATVKNRFLSSSFNNRTGDITVGYYAEVASPEWEIKVDSINVGTCAVAANSCTLTPTTGHTYECSDNCDIGSVDIAALDIIINGGSGGTFKANFTGVGNISGVDSGSVCNAWIGGFA